MRLLAYLCNPGNDHHRSMLESCGFAVVPASTVKEAMELSRRADVAAVIIEDGFSSDDLPQLLSRHLTLTIRSDASREEVAWELSLLFSNNSCRTQ